VRPKKPVELRLRDFINVELRRDVADFRRLRGELEPPDSVSVDPGEGIPRRPGRHPLRLPSIVAQLRERGDLEQPELL